MFSTRLRKHPDWASVIPSLVGSQRRWEEKDLETYDISISLPSGYGGNVFLRMLLLSATDLKTASGYMSRIERFFNDGSCVGIVFLLHGREYKNDNEGMTAYMELQAKFLTLDLDIQVLPLFTTASLLSALWSYSHRLFVSRPSVPLVDPITMILPHCTSCPQLSEHPRNVLSDICHNFRGLAEAATTPDGKTVIRQYLSDPGPQQAEEVIQFWQQEFRAL